MINRLGLLTAAVILLSSCSLGVRDGGPPRSGGSSYIPDPVPRAEPRSKSGNPPSYVINGQRYVVRNSSAGYVERGIASWYGKKFHGRKTANGEIYNMYALTAAHTSLPLPTYVQVTNLKNGRSVVVRVNDRGPFHDNRLIDLSYAAANKLDIVGTGTGLVEVRALTPGKPVPSASLIAQAGTPAISNPSNNSNFVKLYLQIGAFVSRNNAEQLRSRLNTEALPPVHIMQASNNSSAIYRVRVGPIDNVDEADRLAERIKTLGVGTPHVVID
ncbi:MAG: septal ring lytic transglycosylase RlpA family protein [Thiohalomonadaceae bacterium]